MIEKTSPFQECDTFRKEAPMGLLSFPRETAKILIVDDEESVRSLLYDLLCETYACDMASSGEEALGLAEKTGYNVIVSDIMMPGISGIDLLEHVLRRKPETTMIMVSAVQDTRRAINALRKGAYDYIVKPFELEEVELGVARAIEHQRLVFENRLYQTELENLVAERTEELREVNVVLEEKGIKLADLVDELSRTYRATLSALASALDARDSETRGHSERVVAYSLRLGIQVDLSREDLLSLEQGALLHDVGKIGVRDAILLKPDKLTAEEWKEMRLHTEFGRTILEQVPFLARAIPVVAQHHERWNGGGYPLGLSGEQIDIKARVFAVADALDAITSDRPYHRASSYEFASSELRRQQGTQFDPRIVEAFLEVPIEEWQEIRRRANDLSVLQGDDQWHALSDSARLKVAR
jgi:response regulator RpfG family c-di-GMP phosphodiesterase